MFGLRDLNPDLSVLLTAGCVGLVTYLATITGPSFEFLRDQETLALRVVFAIAFVYLMSDVIEGAFLERMRATRLSSPHVWIYAFYMGYYFAVLMILFLWAGMEVAQSLVVLWAAVGAGFGLLMTWSPPGHKPLGHIYDLEAPFTKTPLGRTMYFAWPFVLVAVIAGFLLYPPEDGWKDSYFLFQMVFLGSIMPLYQRRAINGRFLAVLPRLAAVGLISFGLIWLAPTA